MRSHNKNILQPFSPVPHLSFLFSYSTDQYVVYNESCDRFTHLYFMAGYFKRNNGSLIADVVK